MDQIININILTTSFINTLKLYEDGKVSMSEHLAMVMKLKKEYSVIFENIHNLRDQVDGNFFKQLYYLIIQVDNYVKTLFKLGNTEDIFVKLLDLREAENGG